MQRYQTSRVKQDFLHCSVEHLLHIDFIIESLPCASLEMVSVIQENYSNVLEKKLADVINEEPSQLQLFFYLISNYVMQHIKGGK